jgi:glycosyltransferase involved in cell wall biosynthesis
VKILFISPYLPHPLSGHGGGVYLYDMLRHLSAAHTVSLLCFADAREMTLAPDLGSLPVTVQLVPRMKQTDRTMRETLLLSFVRVLQLLRSLFLWQPYYVSKFRHRGMARTIARTTAEQHFDIVQIEYAQMGQYAVHVRQGKTVLHLIDVTFRPAYRYYKEARSLARKAVLFMEWCRWISYEPRMVSTFDGVTTLTAQDQMLLQRLTGLRRVGVLPPGVEIPATALPAPQRDRCTLVFVGNLAQTPNDDAAFWLCSDIFPMILERCPQATLLIIGRSPSAALRSCAGQLGRIKILDFVESLSGYLSQCSLFIAPLRLGGGIKTKILDALAHGIPVVTTPVGVEGISGLNSSNIRVARKASSLAAHTVALLNDPAKAEMLGRLGQEAVIRNYSWAPIMERTVEFYEETLHT